METATVLRDLSLRGILKDYTNNIESLFLSGDVRIYLGTDPTGPSLHVGHLLPLMTLKRLQEHGCHVYVLVGGATGMIGDPSFKSSERIFLDDDVLEDNKSKIRRQIEKLLQSPAGNDVLFVDNKEWFSKMNVIEFLREAGKDINVSYMLAKDSISRRINNSLSFTEFSYQVLQAYDFYYLNTQYGVNAQLGGRDQWGNMTTGVDFVRRKAVKEVHALSTILLTKDDGTKFGKTESGTVWLDASLTSPYSFYQFWFNQSDNEALNLIKIFSENNIDDIEEMIKAHKTSPEKRLLQKQLARELTTWVHGAAECEKIRKSSEIIFGNSSYEDLCGIDDIRSFLHNIAYGTINHEQFISFTSIFEMLAQVCVPAFFTSRNELKRNINDDCITINKRKYNITSPVSSIDLIDNCILIQKGKKKHFAIIITA